MGRSRDEATAEKKRREFRSLDHAVPVSSAQSAHETAMSLRPLQQAASTGGGTRSGAPLTSAGVLALQRTAGNRAACQVIRVQRLQHPDFPKKASDMSPIELRQAWRFHAEGDMFGIGLPPADYRAVKAAMQAKGVPLDASDPLKPAREFIPGGGDVATEVAKPAIALGGMGIGNLTSRGLSTASGAVKYGGKPEQLGPIGGAPTTHGAIGSEVFGGMMLLDSMIGVGRGFKNMWAANKRGDVAGGRLGAKKIKNQSWGVAGAATGVAGGGIKLGAALGSTAAGLAAAAGGLGAVGGALTAAQGSWKIYLAGKKWADLRKIPLLTASGKIWKEYVIGREKRKAGINALKVALGALGVAAGILLITSNPAGWALGIAAMLAGGIYAGGKLAHKIYDVSSRRSAGKKAEVDKPGKEATLKPLAMPQTADPTKPDDPKRRLEAHRLADQVAAENSENAKYAAEMIAALRTVGAEKKIATMVETRDTQFSFDKDFTETRETLREELNLEFSDEDLQWHDAQVILKVLNVSPATALTESGQDLIQKKLSVAEAT